MCGEERQDCTVTGKGSLSRAEFVEGQLAEKIEEHGILLDRITKVTDLQSAWLLLLFCAASRANPVCHPSMLGGVGDGQFAIWIRRTEFEECRMPPDQSSWADTLHMIRTSSTCGRRYVGLFVPRPRSVPLGSSTREPRPSFACRRSCPRMGCCGQRPTSRVSPG